MQLNEFYPSPLINPITASIYSYSYRAEESTLCRFHFTHTSIAVVLALGKEWLTKVVPCAKDRNDNQPRP